MSIHNLGIMKGGKLTNEANEYRLSYLVTDLGCVDLDFRVFPWLVGCFGGIYCPGGMVEV